MIEAAKGKMQHAMLALERLQKLSQSLLLSNVQFISGDFETVGTFIGTSDPLSFSESFCSFIYHFRAIGDAI